MPANKRAPPRARGGGAAPSVKVTPVDVVHAKQGSGPKLPAKPRQPKERAADKARNYLLPVPKPIVVPASLSLPLSLSLTLTIGAQLARRSAQEVAAAGGR